MKLFLPHFLLLLLWGMSLLVPAKTIFVKWDAAGAQTGQSWEDAFPDLQDGLAAATFGDQIWVAKGVYAPGQTTDRSVSFHMKRGVELYGGFGGTEEDIEERDWVANRTTLSGVIQKTLAYEGGELSVVYTYCYHVVQAIDVEDKAVLDGFYIQEGRADAKQNSVLERFGGGLLIRSTNIKEYYPCGTSSNTPKNCLKQHSSNPIIRNCTFRNNFAFEGGAVAGLSTNLYGKELSPSFENCYFWANEGQYRGGAVYLALGWGTQVNLSFYQCNFHNNEGGGINIENRYFSNEEDELGTVSLTVESCLFENNLHSAALECMLNDYNVDAYFSHSQFVGNTHTGGPELEEGGGAIGFTLYGGESSLNMDRCSFEENTALRGGAVHEIGFRQVRISNSAFVHNSGGEGGAISVSPKELILTNNTFFENEARYQGGAAWIPFNNTGEAPSNETFLLENNLFWGNLVTDVFPPVNEIQVDADFGIAPSAPGPPLPDLIFTHNTIEGGLPPRFTNGGGNSSSNPLFLNSNDPNGPDNQLGTPDDGITLSSNSPAINSGLSTALGIVGLGRDLIGALRIYDGAVDKGAYEFGAPSFFMGPDLPSSNLSLLPNPALDFVEIRFESPHKEWGTLNLMDPKGMVLFKEEVYKERRQFRHKLELTGFKEGLYLLRVEFGEIEMMERLLIER